MRNGTQEELDAAASDARLIPRDALFKVSEKSTAWDEKSLAEYDYQFGDHVAREVREHSNLDSSDSVSFSRAGGQWVIYFGADDLEVI